jgi:hypothetical protein
MARTDNITPPTITLTCMQMMHVSDTDDKPCRIMHQDTCHTNRTRVKIEAYNPPFFSI